MMLSRVNRFLPILEPPASSCLTCQSVRHRGQLAGRGYEPAFSVHSPTFHFKKKHVNVLFAKERGDKVQRIELPDFQEDLTKLSMPELRMAMKRKGIYAHRPWNDRPIHVSCTALTIDPYLPPEEDERKSLVSKEGAKQKVDYFGKKTKAYMALRKIYQFDPDFDINDFASEAVNIYIEAHKALADGDEELLHELVTERAYPIMTHETKNKTIRWQFLESVEPPRSVHVRVEPLITDDNYFAQVTIRLHTRQTLAVYDRFGRLMLGSEIVGKDALEYVVFEKHIANEYGVWRIHDKIIPGWAPRPSPSLKTYKLPKKNEEHTED